MVFVDVIKNFFIPGSATFLLIVITTSAVLMWRPVTRAAGRLLLVVAIGSYWLLTLPLVCDWLGGTLPRWLAAAPATTAAPQAIVVLAAGVSRYGDAGISDAVVVPLEQTTLNAIEAARLYRQFGPVTVIASGGCFDCTIEPPESATLAQLLAARGVPSERIIQESTSLNTREQALAVAPILRAHGWTVVALVTSPVHLLRARQSFVAAGIPVVPAPAAFHSSGVMFEHRWTPSPEALSSSKVSMYDYLGYLYYWAHGWLRPAR